MRPLSFAVILTALTLIACSSIHTSIGQENTNPFVAERYGDELADTLANLIINKDPMINTPGTQAIIEDEIGKAKTISADAREREDAGMRGGIIGVKEDVSGRVLLLDGKLYLSSDFDTRPGIDLHVYLTTVNDPRAISFPDGTAVDLGVIQSTYGAQTYAVSSDNDQLRTAVFWDKKLKRLYGFSQLSK